MPEAAIDEDGYFAAREHNVRSADGCWQMQAVAQTHLPQRLTKQHFWACVS